MTRSRMANRLAALEVATGANSENVERLMIVYRALCSIIGSRDPALVPTPEQLAQLESETRCTPAELARVIEARRNIAAELEAI